jgi:hypothetical protein
VVALVAVLFSKRSFVVVNDGQPPLGYRQGEWASLEEMITSSAPLLYLRALVLLLFLFQSKVHLPPLTSWCEWKLSSGRSLVEWLASAGLALPPRIS